MGLYYCNARYYDASTGIFTTQDTYRGNMGNPGTLNYYTYCAGDPINNTDPTGHSIKSLFNKAKKAVSKVVKKAVTKAKKVVKATKAVVKKVNKAVAKKAKTVARKTKTAVKKAKKAAAKKAKTLAKKAKSKIKDSIRKSTDDVNRAVDYTPIEEKLTKVEKPAKIRGVSKAVGLFAAATTIVDAGAGIANDVRNGESAQRTAANAITNVGFGIASMAVGAAAEAAVLFFFPAAGIAAIVVGIYVSYKFEQKTCKYKNKVSDYMVDSMNSQKGGKYGYQGYQYR